MNFHLITNLQLNDVMETAQVTQRILIGLDKMLLRFITGLGSKLGNSFRETLELTRILKYCLCVHYSALHCFKTCLIGKTIGPFIREKISRVLIKSRLIQDANTVV